jgi:hypothetical protein
MRRVVLFALLLLGLAAPAEAVPTWRLLAGPHAGFYFSHAAVESEGQGRIFHTWASVTWQFNPATNTWTQVIPVLHSPSWYENFGSDYDPTNNLVWMNQGTPQGQVDGTPVNSHVFTFDPATSTYVDRTLTEPGGCGANAATAWHNNALFCWGGFGNNELKRKITSPNGPWTQIAPANHPPSYTTVYTGAVYTSWRAGVNRTNNY